MVRTTTTASADLRQEAFDIAASIQHAATLVASREEDAQAFDDAGMTANAAATRKAAEQAAELRDRQTDVARTTDNPHMAAALKVYGVQL